MRFRTLLRREINRFWQIKRQTLLTPMLETYLYIAVFGASLGTRIKELEGFPYIVYIIPGLIMMAMAMNAFSNNSSSIFQQKLLRSIDDQLASPLSNWELLAAYLIGGVIRGTIIASVTFLTANLLIDLPLAHPLLFAGSLIIIGFFFGLLGLMLGIIAESFDNLSLYQSFILQPLIFLGGVFYSATLLPEPYQTITHFNPLFYMINTVRYGMLGSADVNPWISIGILTLVTGGLLMVVYRLFQKGYKLRF